MNLLRLGEDTRFVFEEFAPDGRSLVVSEHLEQVRNEQRPPRIWFWPEGRVEIPALPERNLVIELSAPQPLHVVDLEFSPDASRLYLWEATSRLLEWDWVRLRRDLPSRQ